MFKDRILFPDKVVRYFETRIKSCRLNGGLFIDELIHVLGIHTNERIDITQMSALTSRK